MRQYNNGSINDNASDDIVQAPDAATLTGADDDASSGTFGFLTGTSTYYKLDRAAIAGPGTIPASKGGFWVPLSTLPVPLVFGQSAYLSKPATGDLTGIAAVTVIPNGGPTPLVLAGQPDVARTLDIDIIDGGGALTGGVLTVTGRDQNGQNINEVIPLTGGTHNVETQKAYAVVTSAILTGVVGATGAETVSVGLSTGLGVPTVQGATVFAVMAVTVDGVPDAAPTIIAPSYVVRPSTLPNGAHNYQIQYIYTASA